MPNDMSRSDLEAFLKAHSDTVIDILLDAYTQTVTALVTDHMAEDAADWPRNTEAY